MTLSDALLPMPPGDTATESSELLISMPHAAGTTPHPHGAMGPTLFRSGDVHDTTGPSDSGGVAQLLPPHSGTIQSDALSTAEPFAAHVAAPAPAASETAAAVSGLNSSCMSDRSPPWSGGTHAEVAAGVQQPERSQRGPPIVAQDHQQRAEAVEEAAVVQGSTPGAADGAAGGLRQGNVVDGAVSAAAVTAHGVLPGGHAGQNDAKPGREAASDQKQRSWMGTWFCCGNNSMADS